MRYMFLAAVGALGFAGAASAQQPAYQPAPQPYYPAAAPAAAAATPLQPASGTVIHSNAGCTNCGSAPAGPTTRGYTMSAIKGVTGGNCQYGYPCQNGCGSVRSDLGFHFGSCKNFFAPCGPAPLNAPWGQGFGCPRTYDSYANH